jgi:hypothetical protein
VLTLVQYELDAGVFVTVAAGTCICCHVSLQEACALLLQVQYALHWNINYTR